MTGERKRELKRRLAFYVAVTLPLNALFGWWYILHIMPARMPGWQKDVIVDIAQLIFLAFAEALFEIVRARKKRQAAPDSHPV